MSDIVLKTGTFTQASTAIAVDIEVGFVPSRVSIINETDGITEEWNSAMADAEGILNPGSAASTISKLITSNGITPILSSATDASHTAPTTIMGFTFGLDTFINVASKVYTWQAFR